MELPIRVYTKDFKDTSITVWWQGAKLPADVDHVVVEQREFPKPEWVRIVVPAGQAEHVAVGLFPNATFEFRLRYAYKDGRESEPGPAAAADTLAAGCVPKDGDKKKNGCTAQ